VKSKFQGINKLRDLKKAHRDRVKELVKSQMTLRDKCSRKIRKLDLAAKLAASKVP
jgi:hypothetical protein